MSPIYKIFKVKDKYALVNMETRIVTKTISGSVHRFARCFSISSILVKIMPFYDRWCTMQIQVKLAKLADNIREFNTYFHTLPELKELIADYKNNEERWDHFEPGVFCRDTKWVSDYDFGKRA